MTSPTSRISRIEDLKGKRVLKANGIIDPNTDVQKTVNELIDPTFTERIVAAK